MKIVVSVAALLMLLSAVPRRACSLHESGETVSESTKRGAIIGHRGGRVIRAGDFVEDLAVAEAPVRASECARGSAARGE